MEWDGKGQRRRAADLSLWYHETLKRRDLRYYRIGIKIPILWPQSIVSVSYQYRNFSCESINISIGIEILDIESISISIGINFLISSLKLSITAIYTPLWTLECQQNIRFHCFFGQEMAILSKNLVSKLVSELSREVSVSVSVSNFRHGQYRYQYQYRKFRPGKYQYQYRYRVFDPKQYQYRIGIEKVGIEGLCLKPSFIMPSFSLV